MNDQELAATRGLTPDLVYRLRTELGDSPESVAAMPEAALRSALRKLEDPDRPRRRVEFELAALVDEGGHIPDGSIDRAHRQAVELKASEKYGLVAGLPTGDPNGAVNGDLAELLPSLSGVPPLGALAGIDPQVGWTELGPDNIGGRTRAIVIDPTDPDRIYAAGVGGGVWRSLDAGGTWHPTDDLMSNLAVCCLAMHPGDPAVVLAGTGEGFSNLDAIRGDGIFRSTDGGGSWARLESTDGDPNFHYVNSIVYNCDGTVILAATDTGIWRSDDDGASWTRSFDRGPVGNLAAHPTDPGRAIAGGLRSGRAYHSASGGASWDEADCPTPNARRVQVAYAAADPNITYASVDATPSVIWRSSDGGETYQAKATRSGGVVASYLGQQGWYDNVIWAGDPTDENLVVVGGVDLWRSLDGGETLTQISTWWSPESAHADHHVIVAHPHYDGKTNRQVFFGNDGGVYRTDDVRSVGGNAAPPYNDGWVGLNDGYAVTQFYFGAAHIATSTILGGTQDNGTLTRTPADGNVWAKAYGGDGGVCASDPRNPQVWYGEYVNLNIFRNTNGGLSDAASEAISGQYWDGTAWRWKNAPYVLADSRDRLAEFIAPFTLDPNDPDRLLAGGRSLWLCPDPLSPNTPASGPTWRPIKPPIGTIRSANITAVVVADGNSDVIIVGHGNGEIHATKTGTAQTPLWSRIDENGAAPGIGDGRKCLSLTIDPDDHNIVYATFGGYSSGNIWKTVDGGRSWRDLSGPLPAAPMRAVALHPQRSRWVYLATEVGLFTSEDGGETWSANNEGPADVACRDLFWLGKELVVATHGRGMFQIDLGIANAFPDPVLEFVGVDEHTTASGEYVRYRLRVTNHGDYPGSLFRPSPDLPPCGTNNRSSRTWVDLYDGTTNQRIYGFCSLSGPDELDDLWFLTARGVTPPSTVRLELRDRRCGQNLQSNAVAIPTNGAPRVRSVTRVVRSPSGRIEAVAGEWGQATVAEVAADLRSGRWSYQVGAGDEAALVAVVNGRSGPYLRTRGDATTANNLTDLPSS